MTTYKAITTQTFENIKIVETATSNDLNPTTKYRKVVFVDGEKVTGNARHRAIEAVAMANFSEVKRTHETNF